MTTLTLTRPYAPTEDEVRAAVRARKHLLDFCQWVNPYYERAPHLELFARELEAIERGENDRLIVQMPPRYGKTKTGTVNFSAWYLLRNPRKQVITASYGASLGHEFGGEARNVFADPRAQELFPGVSLSADSTAKNRWTTNHGGSLVASGIPGPITGRGAHLLNIDDPVKSREEADSVAYREAVWQWYLNDARTRLEPGGAVVLTQTRWHEDDLAGRLQREQPGRWRVLCLPALAGPDDPLGRAEGEPLWPARFDAEALALTRAETSERVWSALYQQSPSPAEGMLFKWFPRQPVELPDPAVIYVPIDTAVTGTETSDYWAWAAWGQRPGHIDWLGADRIKAEPPVAEEHIFRFITQDLMRRYPQASIRPMVRKSVAIDRMAAAHLRARRIPVVEVPLPSMGGSHVKEGLAGMVVDYFQSGIARVPDHAPNLDAWIEEHKGFPSAPHDHWVETTIIALHAYRMQLPDDPTHPSPRTRGQRL